MSYYESGDWEEALTSYTKAINIEQQTAGEIGGSKEYLSLYLNNRGLAHYHTRSYEDAMKDYNDAIAAVNGTNAENFFNRGNVYLNQEQFDQAHEDFNQAIQLDKNSAKLYHAKGLAYQSEAEKIAKKEPRDLLNEDILVSKAIESFGDALACDQSFISSMFH